MVPAARGHPYARGSWDDFGREGHDCCRISPQRALKKCGFDLFDFPAEALMLEVADETSRWTPCPWTLLVWWSSEPLPTAAACGVRAFFSLRFLSCTNEATLLPQGPTGSHRVPQPLALPPRSDLLKAPETLPDMETQGRFPGRVSQRGGRAPSWSPEGWSLLAHAPVPIIACPSKTAPAVQGGEAGLWMWGGDAPRQMFCTGQ